MRFLRRAFYLCFGLLALLLSAAMLAWILNNVFSLAPDPAFVKNLGQNALAQVIRILMGVAMTFVWAVVGAYWVQRSGFLEWVGRRHRRR